MFQLRKLLILAIFIVVLSSFVFAGTLTWMEESGINDGFTINSAGEYGEIRINMNESFTLYSANPNIRRYSTSSDGTITAYASLDESSWTEIGTYSISNLNENTYEYTPFNGTNTFEVTSGSYLYLKFEITECINDCNIAILSGYNPNPFSDQTVYVYDGSSKQARNHNGNIALYEGIPADTTPPNVYLESPIDNSTVGSDESSLTWEDDLTRADAISIQTDGYTALKESFVANESTTITKIDVRLGKFASGDSNNIEFYIGTNDNDKVKLSEYDISNHANVVDCGSDPSGHCYYDFSNSTPTGNSFSITNGNTYYIYLIATSTDAVGVELGSDTSTYNLYYNNSGTWSSRANDMGFRLYDSAQVPIDKTEVNSSVIHFVCNATDDTGLNNSAYLYTNSTGTWDIEAGNFTFNTSLGRADFYISGWSSGEYVWNCLFNDTSNNTAFASSNLTINYTAPSTEQSGNYTWVLDGTADTTTGYLHYITDYFYFMIPSINETFEMDGLKLKLNAYYGGGAGNSVIRAYASTDNSSWTFLGSYDTNSIAHTTPGSESYYEFTNGSNTINIYSGNNVYIKLNLTSEDSGEYTQLPVINSTSTNNLTTKIYYNSIMYDKSEYNPIIQLRSANTTVSDSCSCPGLNQNWQINWADKCVITSDCNIGTGNITFTNTNLDGGFNISNANVSANNLGYWGDGNIIWLIGQAILDLFN